MTHNFFVIVIHDIIPKALIAMEECKWHSKQISNDTFGPARTRHFRSNNFFA